MLEPITVADSLDAGTAISLAGLVYLLLAVIAAVHVLLNKNSEGAAISWMGIIILSPLFGALLYGLFGINRLRGQAESIHSEPAMRRLRRSHRRYEDGHDFDQEIPVLPLADLVKTGDALHSMPLVPGNSVQPLMNGDEAYPVMLSAIDSAQHSVLLSSYIFQNDAAGKPFVEALSRAQQRGVTVRVLIDGVGARYGFLVARADRALRKLSVPTARFLSATSPMDWRFINLRNHRKLMVVDSSVGFIGGLNIRAGNEINKARWQLTRDMHFEVRGPVVSQLLAVFLADWAFATGETLQLSQSEETGNQPTADETNKGIGNVCCRTTVDGPDNNYEQLRLTLMAAINAAQHRIDIQTPYFLPNNQLLACLRLASLRGVTVRVLLPESSNLLVVEWAMRANEQRWLEAGLQIVLGGRPFDHSKLFLVDDEWVLIGSSNWDSRSLELNFEVNLECFDAQLSQQVSAVFDAKWNDGVVLNQQRDKNILPKLRNNFCRLFSPYL